jgi:hypothetical protein
MKIHEALKIAVEEMERRKMFRSENFRMTASRTGQEWVFWFVFLPEKFGEDLTAFVSDDGKVRFLDGM